MSKSNIEIDLQKTMEIISSKWNIQNNYFDKETNFIYQMHSLDECLDEIKKRNVNKEYALHRWYNYMTSIQCEYIFCEFGAVHENDIYNHDIDIYINSIPFDIKLTVYPTKLSHRPYDLTTREGKNEMLKWYYANQSQQNRKQLVNRLYVVCDASSAYENLVMKSNFSLIRQQIKAYMDNIKLSGINEITIFDDGKKYVLKSDIVYIH